VCSRDERIWEVGTRARKSKRELCTICSVVGHTLRCKVPSC